MIHSLKPMLFLELRFCYKLGTFFLGEGYPIVLSINPTGLISPPGYTRIAQVNQREGRIEHDLEEQTQALCP